MAKWRLRLFWAAVLAVVTAWGIKGYLESLRETEPVVVAARAIPVRGLITAEMIEVVEVNSQDREVLAADAFRSADEVVGRYARRPFAAGEVLRDRPAELTGPGEVQPAAAGDEGAMADFLPPHTRAVTLTADPQAVLGRHLRSGDWVDLIFTSKSDSTGGVYASMILQRVRVLDIERYPDASLDDPVLVTVLVTPEQAVDVTLAKRTGVVDLALHPPDPGEPAAVPPASPLKFTGQAGGESGGQP